VRQAFQPAASPALGRLESRPDWQTRMFAPRRQLAVPSANFRIQDYFFEVFATGSSAGLT